MFAQSIFVWCMSWNMWKLHFILWRHSYSFGLWIFYLVGSLHLIQCIGGKKLLVGRQLLGGLGNNFSGLLSTSHEITCSNPLFQVSVFLHCCSFLFIFYFFFIIYLNIIFIVIIVENFLLVLMQYSLRSCIVWMVDKWK